MSPQPPAEWFLGGKLEIIPDLPITVVFLVLFLSSAIAHIMICHTNRHRQHKFALSGIMIGFSISRCVALITRIASITHNRNIRLSIAAQVFLTSGSAVFYAANLVFAQRLIRARHPNFGWSSACKHIFVLIFLIIALDTILTLVLVVQRYFIQSAHVVSLNRELLLYGLIMFAIIAFLPFVMVCLSLAVPPSGNARLDKLGTGSWRAKNYILLFGSGLMTIVGCYHAAMIRFPAIPRTQPLPSMMGKAAFYLTGFALEVTALGVYALVRVDRRFHIPDGAKGPGAYKNNVKPGVEATSEDTTSDGKESG